MGELELALGELEVALGELEVALGEVEVVLGVRECSSLGGAIERDSKAFVGGLTSGYFKRLPEGRFK